MYNRRRTTSNRASWLRVVLLTMMLTIYVDCGDPIFDPTTLMRLVLVPADATVGSVIYRIRAHDNEFDYPLHFDMIGDTGRSDVSVETLPCTRYNSVCQANVILQKRLEPGRYIDFRVSVRNTRGRSNQISCSITATNATTPRDVIFPHIPALIMVPEDAKRGTELDYIVARKNPLQTKPVYLELWGSPLFAIRQKIVSPDNTEGTIFLIGPLDFETQSMYHLTVLANDAYAEPKKDTRNIAGIEVVIVVQDVQDMPPVFTSAPPVTHLPPNLVPGDIVVRVHAEDGDKGAPRQIRYGLVSEGNPFTPFFNINETTGDVTLERSLDDIAAISHVGTPVLLTVVAEEIKVSRDEPEAMSATVQLAFIMPERGNSPPYFENDNYITRIDENSPQGTALVFLDPYIAQVSDDDAGKNGVFSITLAGNNGTFEISPSVGERRTNFLIKVRDNRLLDYESRQSVIFQIVAQELGPATNLSTSVNVTVYLNDVNDNPPTFLEESYEVELAENATAGTRVVQVKAEDVDTGIFGKVQYTAILGYLNTSLHMDPRTGIITVATNNHGFDREAMPDVKFLIEVRDNDGIGNRATVPLTIKLLDVNDETPEFERPIYEFILSANLKNFTSPAIIKAIDKDAEPPNNIVRYELVLGNYENKFALNEITGELYLLEQLKRSNSQSKRRSKRQFEPEQESEVYVLTARAYDLGVPHRFSTTTIKVYPPESKTRTMLFLVPGTNPDRQKTEEILSTITGGKVTISEIRPYKGNEVGVTDVTAGNGGKERSIVVATILSTGNSLVDVSHIQQQLNNNKTVGSSSASVSTDDASVTVYKAENKVLFWLLIFLAICIILALLCLIFCCICEGCPLYMPPRKRVIRVNSTDDDVHLVVREKGRGQENKSVQAAEWYGRKEAWSAGQSDSRTKATQWRFNRRNNHSKEIADLDQIKGRGDLFTPTAANNDIKTDDKHSMKTRDGPNIIYTKDMQNNNERYIERNIYVDDIDREYSRITTHRDSTKNLQSQNQDELDADSIRRHEMERGSDVDYMKLDVDRISNAKSSSRQNLQVEDVQNKAPSSHNQGREHMFIKEGNTEILRLVTRDGLEEERYVNLPVGQRVRPVTMIPQQYVVIDSGKDILMQRFIADQGDEAKHIQMKMENSQNSRKYDLNQDRNIQNNQYRLVNGNYRRASNDELLLQGDYQNVELSVPGSVHLGHNDQEMTNNPIGVHRNINTSSHVHHDLLETSLRQQNELLRQILLEKGRLPQYHDASSQFEIKLETQSLPGHSVMATQTDCHMSTQTEPHHLKPARRKARSDIDESYSEEEYEMRIEHSPKEIRWIKRRRPKKRRGKFKEANPRRCIKVEEVKRKIKTPILEEAEASLDIEGEKYNKKEKEDFHNVYGETRTSILRKKKNEPRKEKMRKESDRPAGSALKKDILLEISNSLDDDNNAKEKRPKLVRQTASTKYDENGESSSDDNNENYIHDTRRDSNDFTDDSLEEYEHREIILSCKSSAIRDKRNLIFSRQGSSTDAKDGSTSNRENDKKSKKHHSHSNKVSSLEKEDEENDENLTKENINKVYTKSKGNENDMKKMTDKGVDVSKSVPRYMQWYNNKNNGGPSAAKPNETKAIPPKPKRATQKTRPNRTAPLNDEPKQQTSDDAHKKSSSKQTSEKAGKSQDPKKGKSENREGDSKVRSRLMKEEKVKPVPEGPLPDCHPLLQHSEHRYEREYQNQNPMCFVQPTHLPQYLGMNPQIMPNSQPLYINQIPVNSTPVHIVSSQNGLPTTVYLNPTSHVSEPLLHKTIEDTSKHMITESPSGQLTTTDLNVDTNVSVRHFRAMEDDDSGIAMTSLFAGQNSSQNLKRLPITEKQSVFTIAYNDVQTKQLRPDSSTPSF